LGTGRKKGRRMRKVQRKGKPTGSPHLQQKLSGNTLDTLERAMSVCKMPLLGSSSTLTFRGLRERLFKKKESKAIKTAIPRGKEVVNDRTGKHISRAGIAPRRFIVFGRIAVSPKFDWSVKSVTSMVNGCILGSVGIVTVDLKAREL
jgi:hypothetical protein